MTDAKRVAEKTAHGLWLVVADGREIVFQSKKHADQFASAPALLNMLQRLVDECSETRVAPEGILASAPCLLTLEHARAEIESAYAE